MSSLLVSQILDNIKERFDEISPLQRPNYQALCQVLLKSPRLQDFQIQFMQRLSEVLNIELTKNMEKHERNMRKLDNKINLVQIKRPTNDNAQILYRASDEIEKTKFNYQKMLQDKRLKQSSQFVPMQKFNVRLNKILKNNNKLSKSVAVSPQRQFQPAKFCLSPQPSIAKIQNQHDGTFSPKNHVMSDFQYIIKEQADSISKIVTDMEINHTDLKAAVDECNDELMALEQERENIYFDQIVTFNQSLQWSKRLTPEELRDIKTSNALKFQVPGQKVQWLLKRWQNELNDVPQTPGEFEKFKGELWLSLEEFERQLQETSKEKEFKNNQQIQQLKQQLSQHKDNSLFYIQSLEQALLQCKQSYMNQIDQLQMEIEDMRSAIWRLDKGDFNSGLLEEIQNQKFNSVSELREKIDGLIQIINRKDEALQNQIRISSSKDYVLQSFDEKWELQKKHLSEEKQLRSFYQTKILKLIRDLNLINDNKFSAIHENLENYHYQKEIVVVLQDLGIQQKLIDFVNKYFGMKEGLEKLKQTLNNYGLIAKNKKSLQNQYHKDLDDSLSISSIDSKKGQLETIAEIQKNTNKLIKKVTNKSPKHKQIPQKKESTIFDSQFIMKKSTTNLGDYRDITPAKSQNKKMAPQRKISSTLNINLRKTKNKMMKREIAELFSITEEGVLEEPVATLKSGQSTIEPEAARIAMFEIMQKIKPGYDLDEDEKLEMEEQKKKPKLKSIGRSGTRNRLLAANKSVSKAQIINQKINPKDSKRSIDRDSGTRKQDSSLSLNKRKVVNQKTADQVAQINLNKNKTVRFQQSFTKPILPMGYSSNLKPIQEKENEAMQSPEAEQDRDPVKDVTLDLTKGNHSNSSQSVSLTSDNSIILGAINESMEERSPDENSQATAQVQLKMFKVESADDDLEDEQGQNSREKSQSSIRKQPAGLQKKQTFNQSKLKNQGFSRTAKKLVKTNSKSLEKQFNLSNRVSTFRSGIGQTSFENPQIKNFDQEGKGIVRIEQELSELIEQKYHKLLDKTKELQEEDPKQFKLSVHQIGELQQIVKSSLLTDQFTNSDNMALFQSEVGKFFENLDKIICKSFELDEQMQKVEELKQMNMDLQSEISNQSKKKMAKAKKIKFADMMKPIISEEGEFMGVSLRHDLANSFFETNNFDINNIKKIVKASIFINRLIKDGFNDEFYIKQVKGTELIREEQKEYSELGIQVDQTDIDYHANLYQDKDELEPEDKIFRIIKDHAIDIYTRMRPHRKTYQKLMWEEYSSNDLLQQRLDDVFSSEEETSKCVVFEEYLNSILLDISTKIISRPKDQRQKIYIDEILSEKTIPPPETKDCGVNTGEELIPVKIKEVIKEIRIIEKIEVPIEKKVEELPEEVEKKQIIKPKNQLILDQALNEEFKNTIKLFDKFVDYLNNLSQKQREHKLRKSIHNIDDTTKQSRDEDDDHLTKFSDHSYVVDLRKKLQDSVNLIKSDLQSANQQRSEFIKIPSFVQEIPSSTHQIQRIESKTQQNFSRMFKSFDDKRSVATHNDFKLPAFNQKINVHAIINKPEICYESRNFKIGKNKALNTTTNSPNQSMRHKKIRINSPSEIFGNLNGDLTSKTKNDLQSPISDLIPKVILDETFNKHIKVKIRRKKKNNN